MPNQPNLRIERFRTPSLSASTYAAVITLCDAAFEEETGPYFGTIAPGEHLLAWEGRDLVSHLMWVPRWLQPAGRNPLRTAYVEMVATAVAARGRGHATRLLEMMTPLLDTFELAALAPATENVYRRLGWSYWRGPLGHRKDLAVQSDPEERIMFLRLPRTPRELEPDQPLSVEWRPGEVW